MVKFLWSYLYESCGSRWISYNANGLQTDLQNKLFGQHLASGLIVKAVSEFMNDYNTKKPLVLCLHGWTGTGKNFATRLIAKNIYLKGMNSSHVHFFTPDVHFPHSSQITTYQSQIQQWIHSNVSTCGRSMFIFDKIDRMHPDLIDTILPYLDNNMHDGVSYQRAIFIFLSDAGGDGIVQTALDYLSEGRRPEQIEFIDLEVLLYLSEFEQSGLWHATFIENGVVDFFIPFLPLEHHHVAQCVLAALEARGLQRDQKLAEKLTLELRYFPKDTQVFSVEGCKPIERKVDALPVK
ncbi:uncharacterized protein V6R79_000141 [Siganus canaliculatus]